MENVISGSTYQPAVEPARQSLARTARRVNIFIGFALLLTMVLGGYFRFVGLNWDDFTHLHPDERFLTDVTQGLGRNLNPSDSSIDSITPDQQIALCVERYPATRGLGGYFDALCSPFNPHNANSGHGMYVYGTLPPFLTKVVAQIVTPLSEWWANQRPGSDPNAEPYSGFQWQTYDGVHLIWRYLSALAEMAVIVVVFCIGLRLHGKWVGLLAAVLYAGVVFSIQLSHFATTDAISDMFTAVTILFAVCVQRQGKLRDYLFFGIFFGCALASRINLLPLVGLIFVAAILRILPSFSRGALPGERERQIGRAFVGIVIAGIATIVIFRLANPYAFMGPGIFGLTPNPRFLQDLATAQALVSGSVDSPPNFQWASRTPYVFPWWNMVMWGMGLPLGLAAWGGLMWAIIRLFRGRPSATLNLLLIIWVVGYFGYMGRNWVMTMRYFIPLYSALVVLAAWALITLFQSARTRELAARMTRFGWRSAATAALIIGVTAFTLLWAGMYTNVYRNLLTRVQAGWWVWDNLQADFSMRVVTPDGQGDRLVSMNDGQYETRAIPLINIPIPGNFAASDRDLLSKLTRFDPANPTSGEILFTVPASGIIAAIEAPHLGDPTDNPENEVLRFTIRDGAGEVVATATLDQNLTRTTHIAGDPVTIPLDQPLNVTEGDRLSFQVDLLSDGPVVSGGTIFTWEGAWDDPVPMKLCRPADGTALADDPPSGMVGDSRDCLSLDPWFGFVNGFEQNVVYEDEPIKLEWLLDSLDHSDYIAISSNRFYDTLNRNTLRWPMTNAYYQALFDGSLGWELVATFQEQYELGPLKVSDQYLPTYNGYRGGDFLNEFESEEAFSVYDHPVVFIFRQSEDYDPDVARAILGAVPLTRVYDATPFNACPEDMDLYYCTLQTVGVATWSTEEAARAPTALMQPPQVNALQQDGGTWSDRFASESPVNTNAVVSVVAWYGALFVFGLITFPLLYCLLPRLADRGYSLAKFTGIFLVAFVTWFLASLKLPVWSQVGIIAAMIALAALSMWLVRARLREFGDWVRRHWKRLLIIELLTLGFFLAFVVYRLANPDLWHDSFGGEKPMDFAYFNAVLRSTVFPPYDAWYSGGFINYYYFGFVIVGTPVLLLKMMPSIAFNLIVPTLFALTAIGAFSVTFNVMDAFIISRIRGEGTGHDGSRLIRPGSKWLAAVAAMILAVVLGNLDTTRVLLTGLARSGGYSEPVGFEQFLIEEYTAANGQSPTEGELQALFDRAEANPLPDRIRYELSVVGEQVSSVANGISRLTSGDEIYISPDRWFWGPTRVLAETRGVEGSAITEMPAFTFIYADMHAHMIAMPMQFFVMAFIFNELLCAVKDTRRRREQVLALAVGAITVGMLRATNTWDWITYMLFSMAGLGFAWWLRWKGALSRKSVNSGILWLGGFLVISFAAVLPFTTWYASTYNSIRPWTDGKTPLWAFFDIHGLFLFLLLSFLVWDTGRWLHSVTVRTLRGSLPKLIVLAFVVVTLLIGSLVLAGIEYQVTLIALPMLMWVAILFFRQNQTTVMRYLLALIGLALGLMLGVEYIVLDGDIGRQNTIFKFYIQVWLMLSVVGGCALAILWRASERWRWYLRIPWTVALIALVAVASLFPIMAARGKAVLRMPAVAGEDGVTPSYPVTLDGQLFMTWAQRFEGDDDVMVNLPTGGTFRLDDDYAMIRWLQENVEGSPVILEGLGDDTQYRWNSRISIYTGLPAVQGWNFHQRQQRTLDPLGRMVEFRNANVNALYETVDIPSAWELLRLYDVSYVILGNYERAYYNAAGLDKFDRMVDLGLLEVIFESGTSRIYRVIADAEFDFDRLDVG